MHLVSLSLGLFLVALGQNGPPAPPDLGARVDRVVHQVDDKWVLVGASGELDDRVHQWRRLNEIMTVGARQFDSMRKAERHVRELVSSMAMPIAERLKLGSFGVRIEWGDGRSSVYLAIDRTAVVVSAPSAELARRISRRAALEFAERRLDARGTK